MNVKTNTHSHLSNIIRITAWTIQLRIREREQQYDRDKYSVRVYLEDGKSVDWWFESISKVKLALDQFCIGVILGHDPEAMWTCCTGCYENR